MSIGFRGPALLDGVNCQIEPAQKIGLLGRNGAGKTTFMRLLCGALEADSGKVKFAQQIKISLLPQDVPQDRTGCVLNLVLEGFRNVVTHGNTEEIADWKQHIAAEQILSRMKMDGQQRFENLSSGMKRRVLLAQSLVTSPDLLLLDEPTNHLDVDSIIWLEEFLSRWDAALIFVTHDRMFLQKVADRILEIDRGQIFDWSCDYNTFLKRKEAALAAEARQNALFDKKLAQEEVWIRQGIKARRTRNEGRVRMLEKMRQERSERRVAQTKVNLKIDKGVRSGNLVVEAKGISFGYDELQVVDNFSTLIMRGDKVGLLGANGAGKTTLLRLLLGQLSPQTGKIRLGTNVQLAYFDQLREQLDEDQTVQENVGEGGDTIEIAGNAK
ncbi:MAG: ATP-binding cassette domain-containing protein, partial [Planctomycetales bacterium]